MPIQTAPTGGELVRDLAFMLNDLKHAGTTTGAGSTTTWVDTSQPETADGDEGVIGNWVYALEGTAAGQERVSASTYTGSTGTGTFQRAGTALGSGVEYIRTVKYRPTDLFRAIQLAQRWQTQQGISLYPIAGREIVIGSAIPNAPDLFTTANVPDGLTLDGNSTFTSQTVNTLGGRRILRMVTDGTNVGYIRYAIPGWGRFQGRTVRLYVHLRTSIAARTTAQIADGVLTTTDTSTTANDWELLDPSASMSAAATQLQVSIEVSAGAAVTVELAYWYTPEPFSRSFSHLLDADRNIVYIGDLRHSATSVAGANPDAHSFPGKPASRNAFRIFEDADDLPRRLVLDGTFPQGHVLEYHALARHAPITAATTSFTGNPEVLLARAKAIVTGEPADIMAAQEAESKLAQLPSATWRRVQRE